MQIRISTDDAAFDTTNQSDELQRQEVFLRYRTLWRPLAQFVGR